MKNIITHIKLSNYCGWDQSGNVDRILNQYTDIDLTYDNNIYFKLAIKHNNTKILGILLEYYEKTQLKGDSNSLEYKVAKHKLQTVLQDAINSVDISEEMQVVLDKYLPKEEDSDQELDDLEDIQIPYFPNNYASAELTEDNLKILDNHHEKGLDLAGKNEHLLDIY